VARSQQLGASNQELAAQELAAQELAVHSYELAARSLGQQQEARDRH